jgi:hypothetical protein
MTPPAGPSTKELAGTQVRWGTMNDAVLVPFVQLFPRQAAAETRVLTAQGHPTLPDDEYGLLESYCVEVGCHCRRVMLNVVARRQNAIQASISYGFDRDQEWAGSFLDPLNPQSEHAAVLLGLVTRVLTDPEYVARLEAHYYQVKGAVADRPARPNGCWTIR